MEDCAYFFLVATEYEILRGLGNANFIMFYI